MASKPLKVGNRWLGRVRKSGHSEASQYFDTHDEAETFIITTTAAMLALKHKDLRAVKKMTMGKLIDDYETLNEGKKFSKNKADVLRRLKRDLGDVLIPHFTVERVLAYVKFRKKQKAGGVTIGIDLSQLKQVMLTARQISRLPVDIDVIKDAKANFRYLDLDGKSDERSRLPTSDEISAIKAHFESKSRQKIPMSVLMDFAMATGMRLGEILRIKWADLNIKDRTVVIRDRKHPTKKEGNHQTVPLLSDAWLIVMSQPRSGDRIFPYTSATISSIFPRAVQACGIVDLRFHDLRHEGITRLFQDGYSIPEVAVFSGHLEWKALKRYTHIKAKNLHLDRHGNERRAVAV